MFGFRTSVAPISAFVFAGLLGQGTIVRAQPADERGAITIEQRARIEKHVLAENRPSVAAPPEFSAAAGGILPSKIELFWMSPAVELNHYRYAVVDGRTLVVVPYTRRIIAVWSGSPLLPGGVER
jgi:hypothetical protein